MTQEACTSTELRNSGRAGNPSAVGPTQVDPPSPALREMRSEDVDLLIRCVWRVWGCRGRMRCRTAWITCWYTWTPTATAPGCSPRHPSPPMAATPLTLQVVLTPIFSALAVCARAHVHLSHQHDHHDLFLHAFITFTRRILMRVYAVSLMKGKSSLIVQPH